MTSRSARRATSERHRSGARAFDDVMASPSMAGKVRTTVLVATEGCTAIACAAWLDEITINGRSAAPGVVAAAACAG